MKNMQIFEPAMCCSTGLCGVGVDPELLRISTVLNTMEKNNVMVVRHNLTGSPQEFITNTVVNTFLKENGVDGLPITVLDGEIVITGRYPTNDEFVKLLEIPDSYLCEQPKVMEATTQEEECCCSDGDCSAGSCC